MSFLFHPFRFMIASTSGSFRHVHFSSKRSKGFLPMKDINWIRLGCTTVLLTVWGWDISTISLWKPTNLKFQFQQLGTDGCTMQVFNWIQKTLRNVLFWNCAGTKHPFEPHFSNIFLGEIEHEYQKRRAGKSAIFRFMSYCTLEKIPVFCYFNVINSLPLEGDP